MIESLKKHGLFSWNELTTPDLAGSKTFYRELFGWALVDVETPVGDCTYVQSGDIPQGGMMLPPPTDIPDVGRFCVLQDPQGAVVNLITYCN